MFQGIRGYCGSSSRVGAICRCGTRYALTVLILCIAVIIVGVLVLSGTKQITIGGPKSPVINVKVSGSEQVVTSLVDGRIDDPSVVILDAEAVETQSPQSVGDNGADARKSSETRFQSQPSTTAVANQAPTVKPVAAVSIHLVTVTFTAKSNETKQLLRQNEFTTVLRRNLNHSLINSVHVVTANKTDMEEYLRGLELPNRHKIVIVEIELWHTMRGIFQYISDNLVGKDAMYANGDIYLGNGFEKVDASVLRATNILYALSRHGKQEETCKTEDFCGGDFQYVGSHDVFLFHLKEPIPEEALQKLDYKIWSWGSENVLMGMFNQMLHYCMLNPCKILETYHYHCSLDRDENRVRVNVNGSFNGLAPFTSNLTCHPI